MNFKNTITSWEDKSTQYKIALTIDLKTLFNLYSLDLNEYNKQICCPFPFHSDDSPSFCYYTDTNSFFCFGCKIGGGPIEFLSNLLDISKEEAIAKLQSYQTADYDTLKLTFTNNLIERQNTLADFSTYIRLRLNHAQTAEEIKNIEHNTFLFDQIYNSHKLTNKALIALISKIKLKLEV